jgi:hypothetical protein
MSIRVTLADTPQGEENRRKIRVTLNAQPPLLLAPQAPEPLPPKVKAFWDYDEDARRVRAPWRYAESPNEQAMREQLEANGCWTG